MKGPVIRILTAFASTVVYIAKKVVAVHRNVNNDHSWKVYLSYSLTNFNWCYIGNLRYPGCNCGLQGNGKQNIRSCGTWRCPCYHAGRECDPESCRTCNLSWASSFYLFIKLLSQPAYRPYPYRSRKMFEKQELGMIFGLTFKPYLDELCRNSQIQRGYSKVAPYPH